MVRTSVVAVLALFCVANGLSLRQPEKKKVVYHKPIDLEYLADRVDTDGTLAPQAPFASQPPAPA